MLNLARYLLKTFMQIYHYVNKCNEHKIKFIWLQELSCSYTYYIKSEMNVTFNFHDTKITINIFTKTKTIG